MGVGGAALAVGCVAMLGALALVLWQGHRARREVKGLIRLVDTLRGGHDIASAETEPARRMLGAATREIRSPLEVITSFADTMVNAELNPANTRTAAEAIYRRSLEVAAIVDRLELAARVDAGDFELSTGPVDIGPVLHARAELVHAFTDRVVSVDADVDDLPAVLGDEAAIDAIFDALLDNAVKYSADRESIRIEAGVDGDLTWFSVGDAGMGMDDVQTLCCFERSWQASVVGAHQLGGSGMGLYVVRVLVDTMGGTVSVDSVPGKGSVFTVFLRRADVRVSSGPEAGPTALENPA